MATEKEARVPAENRSPHKKLVKESKQVQTSAAKGGPAKNSPARAVPNGSAEDTKGLRDDARRLYTGWKKAWLSFALTLIPIKDEKAYEEWGFVDAPRASGQRGRVGSGWKRYLETEFPADAEVMPRLIRAAKFIQETRPDLLDHLRDDVVDQIPSYEAINRLAGLKTPIHEGKVNQEKYEWVLREAFGGQMTGNQVIEWVDSEVKRMSGRRLPTSATMAGDADPGEPEEDAVAASDSERENERVQVPESTCDQQEVLVFEPESTDPAHVPLSNDETAASGLDQAMATILERLKGGDEPGWRGLANIATQLGPRYWAPFDDVVANVQLIGKALLAQCERASEANRQGQIRCLVDPLVSQLMEWSERQDGQVSDDHEATNSDAPPAPPSSQVV